MARTGYDPFNAMLARQMGTAERTRILPENFRQVEGPVNVSQFSRQIPAPWENPYPFSYQFNRNVFNSALAGAAGATVIPVTFTLPETYMGWLNWFGIYILSNTINQDITFTLRVNDGPVEGYDNWQFPPGAANFVVQNITGVSLKLPVGARVDVLVTNNNANAFTVGAKIAGWYHSEIEENRVYGQL
jgi:hypothetical protein